MVRAVAVMWSMASSRVTTRTKIVGERYSTPRSSWVALFAINEAHTRSSLISTPAAQRRRLPAGAERVPPNVLLHEQRLDGCRRPYSRHCVHEWVWQTAGWPTRPRRYDRRHQVAIAGILVLSVMRTGVRPAENQQDELEAQSAEHVYLGMGLRKREAGTKACATAARAEQEDRLFDSAVCRATPLEHGHVAALETGALGSARASGRASRPMTPMGQLTRVSSPLVELAAQQHAAHWVFQPKQTIYARADVFDLCSSKRSA